jgi:UDP-glucose 4-epimerase
MGSVAIVTGGAGFLGSHLCNRLLHDGYQVVAIDDLSGGYKENVPNGVAFFEADVCRPAQIRRLFRRLRPSVVCHFAAYAAEGLSPFIRRFNYHNNVTGSANVISAIIQYAPDCQLVFASSAAVYGDAPVPYREDGPLLPIDPYGVAKSAIERDLFLAWRQFGLRSICLRMHNVYGPRQNLNDRYRNVAGIFIRQALRGELLSVFGDGGQVRCFTFVDDVCNVVSRLLGHSSRPGWFAVNVGSDEETAIRELAKKVAIQLGVDDRVNHLPSRDEARHVVCDHSFLASLLGEVVFTPLSAGIAAMCDWARCSTSRPWVRPCAIEVPRLLPAYWR